MKVWLWYADGPAGGASGVTDDKGAACRAAEQGMITTAAATATVEEAAHLGGGGWMSSAYEPTGKDWTARRQGDRITWTQSRPPLALAVS